MKHELPKLSYSYDALEPYIDAQTMEIHYTKHHQTYVDKLNAALEGHPELEEFTVETLLLHLEKLEVDDKTKTAIRNHGGGHANHSLFWKVMDPAQTKDEKLSAEIAEAFGSVEAFKKLFTEKATTLFGSGWVWLNRKSDGKLHICSKHNQDSPLMEGCTPILGIDVWEHAYYLKYQNRRAEYIENWWKIIKLI